MGGLLFLIAIGFIAGTLAKILIPGPDGEGFVLTILLGIVGSFIGGTLGQNFGLGAVTGLNLGSIITATVGSIISVLLFRRFFGK